MGLTCQSYDIPGGLPSSFGGFGHLSHMDEHGDRNHIYFGKKRGPKTLNFSNT
jgi:hypothetical protein